MTPADRERSAGATRIARARLKADLTQSQLAAATGLSLRTVQKLDRGEMTNPPIRYLANVAHVLDRDIWDLCEPEWLQFTDLQADGA